MSDQVSPYVPLAERAGQDSHTRRLAVRALFDRAVEVYDAGRPGYPPALIDDLLRACDLDEGGTVLEVGCGTGQLSASLASRVGRLHCVELGAQLAEATRRKLGSHDNVVIETNAFEDADPPGPFDAVVSATAFHWIDPAVAYARAASLLVEGGHLALITNAHVADVDDP